MINNTKTFYLKEHEWRFIVEHCPNVCLNNNLSRQNNTILLALSVAEQEKLIDDLLDLFVSIGLGDDDEPNKIGLHIESLIDVFNPYK